MRRTEQQFKTQVTVKWEGLTESRTDGSATVDGTLRFKATVDGYPQEDIQHWRSLGISSRMMMLPRAQDSCVLLKTYGTVASIVHVGCG